MIHAYGNERRTMRLSTSQVRKNHLWTKIHTASSSHRMSKVSYLNYGFNGEVIVITAVMFENRATK